MVWDIVLFEVVRLVVDRQLLGREEMLRATAPAVGEFFILLIDTKALPSSGCVKDDRF